MNLDYSEVANMNQPKLSSPSYIADTPTNSAVLDLCINISSFFTQHCASLFMLQSVYSDVGEQNRIADLMSRIDKRIENQRLIIEDWEAKKKGIIQKLFKQSLLL